jgi:hypothetical protein
MAESTQFLRSHFWAVAGAATVATAALVAIRQFQAASFVACVVGILVMWKSEVDDPTALPVDLGDD